MERIYIELLNTINTFLDLSSENKKLADEIYEDILVEVNVFKNTFKRLYEELQEIIVLRINHYLELSTVKNFIVFIDDVENDRKLNLNSKSGKGLSSISKILSEIKLLMEFDFDILRSKGKIHQINSPD